MDTLSEETTAEISDGESLRRAAVVAILLAGTTLVAAVLLAPNAEVVDSPVVPTDAPALPSTEPTVTSEPRDTGDPAQTASPAPTHDPVADSDCGPECFREPLGRTPNP